MRDSGSLPTDIIAVFDALPSGTLWGLGKLSLDMKCLLDELLGCLMKTTPHLTALSVDTRGMAWGPTPGSLESHTIGVRRLLLLLLFGPSTHELTPRISPLSATDHRGVLPVASATKYTGVLVHREKNVTVMHPAVRQLNGDDVRVLKSHFSFKYPSLKEARFHAVNFIMKYEKGNVSNSR